MTTLVSPAASARIRTFTDLVAWQKGHTLVLAIYEVTKSFPQTETFGLTSQLRRAAVSVTSNIAEGFRKQSWREKTQYFAASMCSITEIENQLLIAKDVGYLSQKAFQEISVHVDTASKLTHGLFAKTKEMTT